MKLWLLEERSDSERVPRATYDCMQACVVRAKDEPAAREFAAAECGDEGRGFWLDSAWTTCEQLTTKGEPGMVLRDFWEA